MTSRIAECTGAFAMGTVAGVNTRRYHAALLVSLKPPVERRVLVARMEDQVTFDDVRSTVTPDIALVHAFVTYAGLSASGERLRAMNSLRIIGTAREKAGLISFVMEGVHPHDVGTILDMEGVAVRVGHHCAQPLMDRLGVTATCRASFGMYNTKAEVDALAEALIKAHDFFA